MKKIFLVAINLMIVVAAFAQVAFTTLPKTQQIFPRNLSTNLGTVLVEGTSTFAGSPYDEMDVKLYRNNVYQSTTAQALSYNLGVASFSVSMKITAELANYKIEVYGSTAGNLTLLNTVDSLAAGDAFIITGQSNAAAGAVFGFGNSDNQNSYIRVYGCGAISGYTAKWFKANGDAWDDGTNGNCGQWGLRMAKDILDAHSIPIALFNGANSGQAISWFQRNDANTNDANTNYGRLLRRITETGFLHNIRAIFWYQGESNSFGTTTDDYKSQFNDLYSDWSEDYSGFEHLYIIQIKHGCGATKDNVSKIQEAHRELASEIAGASIYATNGTNHASDKCHYPYKKGYMITGDNIYNLVNRDLYGGPNSANIESPYVISGTQTASNQITLYFKNAGDTYTWTNGTEKDFKLEGSSVKISSGVISSSSVILTLSAVPASFTGIDYLGHQGAGSPTIRNSNSLGLVGFRNFPVTPFQPKLVQDAASNNVMIYPNPAGQFTTLQFKVEEACTVEVLIFNAGGMKVYEQSLSAAPGNQLLQVDVHDFAKGVYEVITKTNAGVEHTKLVVQ